MMSLKPSESSAELPRPGELDLQSEAQQRVSEDREAAPVRVGYGEVDDEGNVKFSWNRLLVFAGNLESDLQTGFKAGYTLGWILLWSTVLGFTVQLLAMRMGVVTSKHLAQHCRELYPTVPRTILWLMMEIAIIGSDIQEVIGSAIAIGLLSDGAIPVWVGVLITGIDTFFLLYLERLGVRKLEAFFGILVATMTASFGVMYFMAECPTDQVLLGTIVPRIRLEYMSIAAGMVGALVMPHNIFLHSALVQSREIDLTSTSAKKEAIMYNAIESALSLGVTVIINLSLMSVFASGFHNRPELGITEVGLGSAGRHLGERFGPAMKYIWAIGLFAAGQSSTMTGTYTGQFVMSGFMHIHVSPWLRALITRSVALVPTLAVAIAFAGTQEMDTLNQALNVLQSVQLPFALLPVLYISKRKDVMGNIFVLQSYFRTLVQMICWMLLGLNFVFVALALFAWGFQTFWGGLFVSIAALGYIAFVVYLLIGPSKVHEILSVRDSAFLQTLNRWFGRAEGLTPVLNGGVLGGSDSTRELELLRGTQPLAGYSGDEVFLVATGDADEGSLVQAGSLDPEQFPENTQHDVGEQ